MLTNFGIGTLVARFVAGDETAARRAADVLSETLDPGEASIAVFESETGWNVEIYFRDPRQECAVRDLVELAAGPLAASALVVETLADRDWVASSLAGLAPVKAGRFFIHGRHDRARLPPNLIGIEIEAALAFGSGHHGTTRGCLLALDRLLKARRPGRILDLGTGSGVLAIAAAKSLRRNVWASDIDPIAAAAARGNARANGAGAFVRVVTAAGLNNPRLRDGAPYDLVLANILLGPLMRLARPVAALAGRDATVILSGLLPGHANAALAAYRRLGFHLDRRIDLETWVTLVLRRGTNLPRPG